MRVVLDKGAYMPESAHDDDGGFDLRSREDKVVPAGGSAVFDTGVHVELPKSWKVLESCSMYPEEAVCILREHEFNILTAGLLVSKSGLNVKHNITSTGLVDVGYTGSIKVKLYNHGTEDYHVKAGDKISQLVILPIIRPSIEQVDKLEDTKRGENGFGSSGR